MENQDEHPTSENPAAQLSPTPPVSQTQNGDGPHKIPENAVSDKDAQALLAITSAMAPHQKSKLPMSLIITVIVLILIVVITTFLLGSVKGGKSNLTNGLNTGTNTQSSSNGSGSGIHNQINQDVKSCSNPVNAVTEC